MQADPIVPLRLPKYRRHCSGQARVTLPGKPRRRTVYLGPHGSPESHQAYKRAVQQWLLRGALPVASPDAGRGERTVTEVLDAYEAHAADYYRHSPSEQERIRLSLHAVRELYGSTPAAQFGPLALKTVRQKLVGTQRRVVQRKVHDGSRVKIVEEVVEYRLARLTVNMRIGVIKRVFRWAVENELVPAAVFQGLQAISGLRRGKSAARETEPVRPVADSVVEQTLPFLNLQLRAAVELQRLTGARSGEILGMRLKDIERMGTVWIYRPSTHKTAYRGHGREIYLGPKAQAILAGFLDTDPDAYLFNPRTARSERYAALRAARKSRVPPSQTSRKKVKPKRQPGERYTVRAYRRAILRACQKAGVPSWHPHQLRHTAGTHLRKEFGVEVARIILGHRSLQATEIYSELNRGQALQVMGCIG